MRKHKFIRKILSLPALVALSMSPTILAAPLTLSTVTANSGDSLMLHQLNSGKLWASFQITDQVVESFASNELIVLQIDQNRPIQLHQSKRSCGGAKGKSQLVIYDFLSLESDSDATQKWAFNAVQKPQQDVLKFRRWDGASYDYLPCDRRGEVVDFPLQSAAAIGIALQQQFLQGKKMVFRYVTTAGELRQADFDLQQLKQQLQSILK